MHIQTSLMKTPTPKSFFTQFVLRENLFETRPLNIKVVFIHVWKFFLKVEVTNI